MGSKQLSFYVENASLTLEAHLNTSILQAYYPSMNNCTVLVRVNVTCNSTIHDMEEACVKWHLNGEEGVLVYQNGSQFMGEISTPRVAGKYNLSIYATLANHTSDMVYYTLTVDRRKATLELSLNRTEAAYGDPVEFTVTAFDTGCQKPISGKDVSIFVSNGTAWVFLTNLTLGSDGTARGTWNVSETDGGDILTFKAVFRGKPEYNENEVSATLMVSKNIRLLVNPDLQVIRGRQGNFTVKVTTLDYEAIPNLTVYFIEESTNETWCTTFTNASGYAQILWDVPSWYELGVHEFCIIVYDGTEFMGRGFVNVEVYDATIMTVL